MSDAKIVDYYDLNKQGDGTYKINFTKDTYKGKVRVDSNDLAKLWYCSYEFKLGDNWSWGDTTYDGDNKFLSNLKFFRFWNPSLGGGSENSYMGAMGWEPNLHFINENVPGEPNHRFMSNYKSVLTKEIWHKFEIEFMDSDKNVSNGYTKIWVDDTLVMDISNALSNKTGMLKRPFLIGYDVAWPTSNDKAPNDFWIKNIKAKMNETREGSTPDPDPGPGPDPIPEPDPVPSEFEVDLRITGTIKKK